MQFDGNELEKDDNNIPTDGDKSAISWEDLLNMDEEDDLSGLIVNSDDAKNGVAKEKSDISDFDISTLSEENVLSENKEKFNLNEAAANYVNSLEKDDAAIEVPEVEKPTEDIHQETNTNSFDEDDDILNVLADEDVLSEEAEAVVNKEDLQDVVDDELLSLLDVKNDSPSAYSEGNIDDILEFGKEEKEEVSSEESKESVKEILDNITKDTESDSLAEEEVQEQENTYEPVSDTEDALEIQPAVPNQNKAKPVLIAVSCLVGLFAVILGLVYFLFPNLAGNSSNENLASSENSNYTMPNENVNDAVEMQKQTEELINKLEDKTVEKGQKDNKDKKVIVAVQTSGRANPFMPSSLFNEDGSLAMGADLSLPPDVDVNSPEAVAARKLFSISVSGIMYDPEKPSAILKYDGNDYFVQKGDRIDTYTVRQITKDFVQIANDANVYKAYVGEVFKIGEIPQSRQMSFNGSTRQYVSVDDIEISTK